MATVAARRSERERYDWTLPLASAPTITPPTAAYTGSVTAASYGAVPEE